MRGESRLYRFFFGVTAPKVGFRSAPVKAGHRSHRAALRLGSDLNVALLPRRSDQSCPSPIFFAQLGHV